MSTSSTTTSTTTTTTTTTSSTSSSTTTTHPFYIVDVRPDNLATGVAQDVTVEVDYSLPLDPTTVDVSTVVVALRSYKTLNGETVASNELVPGTVELINGDTTIVFTPDSPLYEEADYDVILDNDITAVANYQLNVIFGWSFQTGIIDTAPDEPSEPQIEPPLKDHYPRELDGLAVVDSYPGQYTAQVPLDLAPNNGLITIRWNKEIQSVGASNVAWDALNGDPLLVDPRHNAAHSLSFEEDLIHITMATLPLVENAMIRVTLQDVRSTDDSLDREYILFFATVVNPYYATIEIIRALVGSFIDRVPDTTLAMLILDASLTADALSNSVIVNAALYQLARRKWVQCRTGYDLLYPTMFESSGKSKRLAEMMVSWEGISPREKILMYTKFRDCIERWEEILLSGGQGNRAIMTIKGLTDPDRPMTGRGWTVRPGASPHANKVVPKVVGRRGIKAPRDPRGYYRRGRGGIYRRSIE